MSKINENEACFIVCNPKMAAEIIKEDPSVAGSIVTAHIVEDNVAYIVREKEFVDNILKSEQCFVRGEQDD